MKVTDETVPEEDLEEAEDAAVVEKRPRRKLFYIEAGKRGTLAKIMIGSILALVLFSLVINSYVQLNEVYSQISAAESTSRFRRRMRLSSKNRIRTFLFRSNGNSTT